MQLCLYTTTLACERKLTHAAACTHITMHRSINAQKHVCTDADIHRSIVYMLRRSTCIALSVC